MPSLSALLQANPSEPLSSALPNRQPSLIQGPDMHPSIMPMPSPEIVNSRHTIGEMIHQVPILR